MKNTIIKQGNTTPYNWEANVSGGGGIYVDVNTKSSGFNKTPHYLTSLEGNKHHWDVSGISAIYNASKSGFKVYIKWIKYHKVPLTPKVAENYGWYLKWTAILTE